MERFPVGGIDPADLTSLLGATEIIYVEEDDLDEEHLTLLWAHPGFQKARRELRVEFAELEECGIFLDSNDQEDARRKATAAAYPLRKFAETWGVSPAAAYTLARTTDKDYGPADEDTRFKRFRNEANAVIVWEDEAGYTIYVPRPLTKPRVAAVKDWLKDGRRPGRLEIAWGLADKSRWQTNPAMIEALPWFERWNRGEEPTEIWKDLQAQRPKLDHGSFVEQLARLWTRMRNISEDELRPDRPSKKRI